MNIKQSYFKWLMASTAVGLFLANCTVKTGSSDDDNGGTSGKVDAKGEKCAEGDTNTCTACPGDVKGHQECNSKGVFGSCICPGEETAGGAGNDTAGKSGSTGGTGNSEGGKSGYTAGTASGGVAAASSNAGAGGEGEGGAAPVFTVEDPNDCEACLKALCAKEWEDCQADSQCYSTNGNGTGQYERIIGCIDDERVDGLVKRDVVRGCGVTVGSSSNPDLASDWAPQNMAAATTNLLNCLATSSSETPNADWANSDDNFPVVQGDVVPTPWPDDSCAKLSCTAKFQ